MGGKISTRIQPGFFRKLLRPQKRPEFRATGTTGKPNSR